MASRYNPAPGWPTPPQGWTPPPGWTPDPSWPAMPAGWQLWVEDGVAPKAKRRPVRGCLSIVGGLVVLIVIIVVIVVVAGGSKKTSSSTRSGATGTSSPSTKGLQFAADVALNSCTQDPTTGWYDAALTVTNHSSKSSTYTIEISLLSADGKTKYDTMLADVEALAPGQASPQKAQSLTSDVPAGAVCKVTSIERFASTS